MIAAMAKIWTVVLIFPSIEGRKPRKPVTMLMAAAPTRIKTSRLITATVTQNGTGRWEGRGCGKTERIDRTTKKKRKEETFVAGGGVGGGGGGGGVCGV